MIYPRKNQNLRSVVTANIPYYISYIYLSHNFCSPTFDKTEVCDRLGGRKFSRIKLFRLDAPVFQCSLGKTVRVFGSDDL